MSCTLDQYTDYVGELCSPRLTAATVSLFFCPAAGDFGWRGGTRLARDFQVRQRRPYFAARAPALGGLAFPCISLPTAALPHNSL